MWVGFCFAAYSAIANDSIQTIGTFIASNRNREWWQLWLFIGGIFVATMSYSWFTYDGDVSHQRLMAKGFDQAPTSFHFLQLLAPLSLVLPRGLGCRYRRPSCSSVALRRAGRASER